MAENMDGGKSDAALREEEILKFWADNKIFEKSLKKDAPKGEFVFYDGPPFATGLPHSGSLLSSVSKDLIPRYKTMRGYTVRRRWGWDTHGLPIESLVEKKLGLKNKKEILQIGVEKFNEEARSMVLEYVHDWKRYVERVGRWVDFDNSYKTMDATYTESVWWGLKQIHNKGNLYEGRKVLLYCPHCETPLAKAEIAMDNTYKDITEETVTAKFKVKNPAKAGLPENTFILAWTTTPWTLPANSALAVNPEIEYGVYEQEGETLVAAVPRAEALGLPAPVRTMKGGVLVGLEYEPLFNVSKIAGHTGTKYTVFAEDYVSADDGTGIVHTGTIYGEEDYALIQKEKLPAVQLLSPNATYNDDAPEFLRGKYVKKAEADIKQDLELRGLLFKKEAHTHSYPHCYRCGTPLIYNAVSSWFINIQAVKNKMLQENESISWFPGHLKHGRFKHIVENAPDWTISRNRFWASPLPIWKDAQGNVTVVGSLEELKSLAKKSGNTYYVMRHGEAEQNVQNLLSNDMPGTPLTEKGKAQAVAWAQTLKGKGITKIYCSPLQRTAQTAAIAAVTLGLEESMVVQEPRLREFGFGDLNHCSQEKFDETYKSRAYDEPFPNGESFQDVKNRIGEFLYELEHRHKSEKILIVTHGSPIEAAVAVVHGADKKESKKLVEAVNAENAEIRDLGFVPLPHNRDYELDYHLPYIDELSLEKDGKPLKRIPEVVDCWVESGSMPFAEYHYPFENKAEFEKRTPGDFISEYIGQTRAWFYYMHAVSTHLFGHRAFKNVITTGNINAADGQKLSKSKKNYTDPYLLFDKYGADAFRYYLMSSVVMQAEDVQFRDEDLKEMHARVVNILRNTLSFYALYKDERKEQGGTSANVLDRWILRRLEQLTEEMTAAFDGYDVTRAARPVRLFIEDFSTWYVRRSRDRVKKDDEADKQAALNTLREVFVTLSKLIAPIMPFIAEEIYQSVRTSADPESVHLAQWPEVEKSITQKIVGMFGGTFGDTLLTDMEEVRRVVSLALEARQKAGVKVRQPLQKVTVGSEQLTGKTELQQLIADEVNVKEVVVGKVEGVELDTTITEELRAEGELRDLIREVQDLRKTAGLNPKDQAVLVVDDAHKALVEAHWSALAKAAGLKSQEVGPALAVRN